MARSAKQIAASRKNLQKARSRAKNAALSAAKKKKAVGYRTKEKLSYDTSSSAARGPIRMKRR